MRVTIHTSAVTTAPTGHPGWRFWVAWVAASIAAVFVYAVLMIPVNLLLVQSQTQNAGRITITVSAILLIVMATGLMGALIGLGQWLVLRRYLISRWWIAATAVGYGLPLIAGPAGLQASLPNAHPGAAMALMVLEFGLLLGVLQWLVLRGRVNHAGWWVPITLAGWAMGFTLTGAAYLAGVYVEPMDMLFAFLVPVAVGGLGMMWLLGSMAPE